MPHQHQHVYIIKLICLPRGVEHDKVVVVGNRLLEGVGRVRDDSEILVLGVAKAAEGHDGGDEHKVFHIGSQYHRRLLNINVKLLRNVGIFSTLRFFCPLQVVEFTWLRLLCRSEFRCLRRR